MPVVAIEPDNDDGEQNGHQHTAYDHRSVHPALPLPPRMVRASLAWPVGRAQSCGAPGDERAARHHPVDAVLFALRPGEGSHRCLIIN